MKPLLTVILPHLRQHTNDQALKVCLECLVDNTSVDYELLIEGVSQRRDIYAVINEMVTRAKADYVVFHNSDVFVAPGWAEAYLGAADPQTIVAGVIVECGAIGVASANVHKDFGMLPQTFRRQAFEDWVAERQPLPHGDGWYFPSLHPRDAFLEVGGFDLTRGVFPLQPLDIHYWDAWRAAGKQIAHVRSYSYHLQHYCSETEQSKAVRHR